MEDVAGWAVEFAVGGVIEVTAVNEVEEFEVGVPSCVADEQAAKITADTRMPMMGICLRTSLLSGVLKLTRTLARTDTGDL